ncbi:hypothetical protein ACIQF6_36020 [Kitasatospora sp. NPDC092948]|uniref:hypothetical protein n=1 Tax=Kitasatospora sp. NPDC092948 TaxID=3364088 RepID=UPI003826E0FD
MLKRAADAVEQACGQEVVPDGDGRLSEELAYDLSANIITGNPYTEELPDLLAGERIALVAVCALAAAAPAVVLGDLGREVPVLVATMDAAVASGRATRLPGDR